MNQHVKQAISAHGQWKTKMQDFLAGSIVLDATTVQRKDACDFGKWLQSQGRADLGADFADIDRLHAEFHAAAAEVVRKKQAGDIQAAKEAVGITGPFTKASAALIRRLMSAA